MSEPYWAKQRTALRYWLQGKGYNRAAFAMTWAEQYHQGLRKDGVTPEFAHQVAIASHLRCFYQLLRYPEETIITSFIHDVREDYDVSDAEVRDLFGDLVADSTDAVTKVFHGVKRDPIEVFEKIAQFPIASVVKPADRVHNHASSVDVFGPQKMIEYATETREFILPMMKKARRTFTDQEPVYEALGLVLATQLSFADALAGARLDS
jgi:(p)ppGpp synthase/HD superfamily hydrolase